MILSKTTAAHKEAARQASINRTHSEFSAETWALDPLDVMTAEQFVQHLVSLYGAEYLEPVQYRRWNGKLLPETPQLMVAELFRQHGALTRPEVRRLTGLSHGRIANIVREPAYVVAEIVKVKQMYAKKWKLSSHQ